MQLILLKGVVILTQQMNELSQIVMDRSAAEKLSFCLIDQ